VAVASQWTYRTTAQSQDVKAAYDRAASLGQRADGPVSNVAETPTFIEGTSKLWYMRRIKGGSEFIVADAATKTKGPAFDQAKLAAGINAAGGGHAAALKLWFTAFTCGAN